MALLIFHLVASSVTFDGVDVKMAEKILEWDLKRYPNGACFPSAICIGHHLTRFLLRRFLPLWRGPPCPHPLAAEARDRLLHARHGGTEAVSVTEAVS